MVNRIGVAVEVVISLVEGGEIGLEEGGRWTWLKRWSISGAAATDGQFPKQ